MFSLLAWNSMFQTLERKWEHVWQGEEGALSLTTNDLGSTKGLPLNHCAGFRPSKTSNEDLNSDGMLLIWYKVHMYFCTYAYICTYIHTPTDIHMLVIRNHSKFSNLCGPSHLIRNIPFKHEIFTSLIRAQHKQLCEIVKIMKQRPAKHRRNEGQMITPS